MTQSTLKPRTLFLVGSMAIAAAASYFSYNFLFNPPKPSSALVQKVESPYETNFPVERVLTVSARDYVESEGKRLEDYDMVGASGGSATYWNECVWNVPKGTEVVVDCKPKNDYVEIGTALIPRHKSNGIKEGSGE
jgi:hypothetical protein